MLANHHTIRIVTAASLFDGHDAAINIMRRIMQSKGAEVIHLGHNRSVYEIVEAAIEEDADAIAVTSYQGGHLEFFKYMYDLLKENGCEHIRIFGGGGGTILPEEIATLHRYGITRIYSPDDGRKMGLEGMIEDLMQTTLKSVSKKEKTLSANAAANKKILGKCKDIIAIARAITAAEDNTNSIRAKSNDKNKTLSPVIGITGTGGSGKSSVTDELVLRFLQIFPDKTVAVIAVDPSRKKSGGALLGDRIRMNSISGARTYMRSLATRQTDKALSHAMQEAVQIVKSAAFDLIILETAGVGQSDTSILDFCDISLYVMTPEYGAASQLEKINMLDYADVIAINKFDKAGAQDALNEVSKQYKRNHALWNAKENELPVVGTVASQFNDDGINHLFALLLEKIDEKFDKHWSDQYPLASTSSVEKIRTTIIPARRVRYLSEITESIREYDDWVKKQSEIANKLYNLKEVIDLLEHQKKDNHGNDSKSSH